MTEEQELASRKEVINKLLKEIYKAIDQFPTHFATGFLGPLAEILLHAYHEALAYNAKVQADDLINKALEDPEKDL